MVEKSPLVACPADCGTRWKRRIGAAGKARTAAI